MTKFYLVHYPALDKYVVKTIPAKRFTVIYRKPDWSPEQFEENAVAVFDRMIKTEKDLVPAIKDAVIVKSEYIL